MNTDNFAPNPKNWELSRGLFRPRSWVKPPDYRELFPPDLRTQKKRGLKATSKAQESQEERLYRLRDKKIRGRDPRPETADEIVGQRDALDQIRSLLSSANPTHMLFLGPAGSGKTTTARIAQNLAKQSSTSVFDKDAPFVEVDGANLMQDKQNNLSPLSSSVMEGFYSGVQDRNAEKGLEGLPEIWLGACARAHLGILFIDEIGELSEFTLNSVLKALEDGKEMLTSKTWNKDAKNAPKWMRHFFDQGVPADFVLIGATTRVQEELPSALVSRCEVLRFRELSSNDRLQIARNTATKLGVDLCERAAHMVAETSQAGRDTARRIQVASARASAAGRRRIELQDIPVSNSSSLIGFRAGSRS